VEKSELRIENEILDAKTKNRYKIVRGFFGGLKLVKTYDWKTSAVGRFGTSGFIFDEERTKTKLRLPNNTPPPTLQPKRILVEEEQR